MLVKIMSKFLDVVEYCPGGELFGLIKKYKRLSEDIARFYII